MAAQSMSLSERRSWWAGAWIVTRRELRDTLRDWRIVVPIVLLTLVFPVIMNFTAGAAQDFVRQYGAEIIGERLIPFLLMIVGFFPISFSLVVALETFVGERERKSVEALLCTPLTNGQLYFGKTLAAMIPPLGAAYLGITLYLIGLYLFRHWSAPSELLIQIILLTTCEAIVMVSGAVVVSSQTTSTRAANLLASFIIIPMALLVQAESIIMFWAMYDVLWGFVAALLVVDLLLVRMGVQLFDREQLLGREFDTLNLRHAGRTLAVHFKRIEPRFEAARFTVWRVYRQDIAAILRRSRGAAITILVATGIGLIGGWLYAQSYPSGLSSTPGVVGFGFAPDCLYDPGLCARFVLMNNLRAVFVSGLVGLFTFGVIPTVVPLVNSALVVFVVMTTAGRIGHDPAGLFVAGVLPHGLFEIPAVWLASIAALRLGAAVIARQPHMTLSESWLSALADYLKVLIFVTLPLLCIAALIEAYVTPHLITAAVGR